MPGPLSPAGRQKALMVLWAAILVFAVGVAVRTLSVAREAGRGGTYARVRALLVRRLSADPRAVRPEASLTGLCPEGIDRLELVAALQDEFEVEIPEGEAAAMSTVQDVVRGIDRLRVLPAAHRQSAEPVRKGGG